MSAHRTLTAVAAAVFVVAGCGSGDDSSGVSTATTGSSVESQVEAVDTSSQKTSSAAPVDGSVAVDDTDVSVVTTSGGDLVDLGEVDDGGTVATTDGADPAAELEPAPATTQPSTPTTADEAEQGGVDEVVEPPISEAELAELEAVLDEIEALLDDVDAQLSQD
ncbi:MAG: hypothetical protein QNJ12_14155 [Ilumatobacter sp.]|uniref:hypothetical protein n=1 Tax=Ilumatobacter sp. TaxID=1967498 RepID=UPI00261EBBD1|nr:hypothetical protein [Ilumatobacter sp.]MDJ0769939.1 hypothetical protein [Ilumatobacter sp.]